MNDTVDLVRKNNLCTACGTCQSVCPHGAVRLVRNTADFIVPEVSAERCTHCGLCLKACPGVGLPESLCEGHVDFFRGQTLGAWVGRATDEDLWKNGQSGGVVSALLLYLLDKGIVDSAIVNGFDPATKRPAVLKAHSKQELLAAQGSYYAQSAVNDVAVGPGAEKTAAVVLGCQAEGIALTRLHAKGRATPDYLIGLICAGNHSGLIIDDLIGQSGVAQDSVTSFRFRDKSAGGWPGNVRIRGDGGSAVLDKARRLALKDFYGNYRCQCCFDQMNVFSDIVVGDPWRIDSRFDSGGRSVVIARTEKGRELMETAIDAGYITAEPVSADAVYTGQTVESRLKPQFFACKEICAQEGMHFPHYTLDGRAYPAIRPNSKQRKQIGKTLKFKYAMLGMQSWQEIESAVCNGKRWAAINGLPGRVVALAKRALRKIYRLLFKRKGAGR